MIFTIGYNGKGITPTGLASILNQINATLVDVRRKPVSKMAGWGNDQLKEVIGEARYVSCTDLGDRSVTPTTMAWLKKRFYHLGGPHCILLGKEEDPSAWHRHRMICARQFPDAMHIFQSRLISAEAWDNYIKRGEEPESIPISELPVFIEHCENFMESQT